MVEKFLVLFFPLLPIPCIYLFKQYCLTKTNIMKKKLYTVKLSILSLLLLSAFSNLIAQELPKSGDLIITEFMSNPAAVSDTKGEWFELMNVSSESILISTLEIKDDGSNLISLEDDQAIILLPGEIFLLARSGDSSENGGLEPDYVFSNFTLSNTEDEIILCLPDGTVLDEVRYNSEWSIQKGEALELNPNHMDSGFNAMVHWDLSTSPYGLGDLGSPGAPNSSSTGRNDHLILEELDIYPNPCFGQLNIHSSFCKNVNYDLSIINLVGQEEYLLKNRYGDELDIQLSTDRLEKGVWLLKLKYDTHIKIRKVLIN